ncbi:SulA-like leucine-rich domain-containing protein [Spartinivicinus ruber]|uniref:SulA-like leucine-rich domain-containing protein n=1 Tax=Spartinivicinus ruber TaxID=2683272 RepID=UPI0013D51DDD|nr:SulA-like leucine-rich domain-containing protein [Spartinivicinus ruber]
MEYSGNENDSKPNCSTPSQPPHFPLSTSHSGFTHITEIILSSARVPLTSFIPPMLAQLSHHEKQRWLTVVCSKQYHKLTLKWLQDAYINNKQVLFLTATNEGSIKDLTLQALSLGKSHTVVSWLPVLDEATLSALEIAAKKGNCHVINIRQR